MEKKLKLKIMENAFYLIYNEMAEKLLKKLKETKEDEVTSLPKVLWETEKGFSTREQIEEVIGRNTGNMISVKEFVELQQELTGFQIEEKYVDENGKPDWKKIGNTLLDVVFEYVFGIERYSDEMPAKKMHDEIEFSKKFIDAIKLKEKNNEIKAIL